MTKDGQEFQAELIIDAAGRRSPLPGWLAARGYQPPKEVEVDPHVTYVSRLYKQTPQVTHNLPSFLASSVHYCPCCTSQAPTVIGLLQSGKAGRCGSTWKVMQMSLTTFVRCMHCKAVCHHFKAPPQRSYCNFLGQQPSGVVCTLLYYLQKSACMG